MSCAAFGDAVGGVPTKQFPALQKGRNDPYVAWWNMGRYGLVRQVRRREERRQAEPSRRAGGRVRWSHQLQRRKATKDFC